MLERDCFILTYRNEGTRRILLRLLIHLVRITGREKNMTPVQQDQAIIT